MTPPDWQRLSRRMLLVHPVHELVRLAPILLALIFLGRGDRGAIGWGAMAAAAAVVLGVIRWATTDYRVTDEQIQIRSGLLQRKTVSVRRDRVRAVDQSARLMHRIVGLVVLTIGTGRNDASGDDTLRLDGLTPEVAGQLRTDLLHRGDDAAPATTTEEGEVELARWHPAWVRFGPLTLQGVATLGVVAAGVGQVFAVEGEDVDADDFGFLSGLADWISHESVAVVVGGAVSAVVVIVVVLSVFGYLFAYWNFRLTRYRAGTLHITRGLLTTRATTLEERRLRGVELDEALSLRIAKGARLTAIATGGDSGASALLLPPAPRQAAIDTAVAVLGDEAPLRAPLRDHGPVARRRRYTRALIPAGVVVAAGAIAGVAGDIPLAAWTIPGAALLVAAALLGADRARNLGHTVAGGWLITQSGSIVRSRAALEHEGIIGVNLRQSFFQRRANLVTLTATTAGGSEGYTVIDVDPAAAVALVDEAVPGLLAPFRA